MIHKHGLTYLDLATDIRTIEEEEVDMDLTDRQIIMTPIIKMDIITTWDHLRICGEVCEHLRSLKIVDI